MTHEEIIAMAREAGFRTGHIDLIIGDPVPFIAPASGTSCTVEVQRFAALVAEKAAAKERDALLGDGRCGEVPLPMQVAARWPSVPGSHKYAGAGGCAPGSFGDDSEDLFTTAQLLDYGDRRAADAIRARGTKEGV